VIDRKLYRGFHGLAGEIGHIQHPDINYRCHCNNIGCLETMVSAPGILHAFRDRLEAGVISSLQGLRLEGRDSLSLEKILAAARQGDRLAQSTLAEIGGFLGNACATLIKLYNPQRLIISGYGSIFRDYFNDPVHQAITQYVLPDMLVDYKTVFTDYESHHEAFGVALLAMNHFLTRRLHDLAAGGRGQTP